MGVGGSHTVRCFHLHREEEEAEEEDGGGFQQDTGYVPSARPTHTHCPPSSSAGAGDLTDDSFISLDASCW